MYEYGVPAEWANGQKWIRRRKAVGEGGKAVLAVVAAVVLIVVLLNYAPLTSGEAVMWVALIAVPATLFATLRGLKAKEAWKRSGHAKVGVASERQVRTEIRKERPLIAAYGLQLSGRADLDLLLVTHGLRVAAVEIKTGFGKVTMYGNQIRAGRNLIKGDPIGQVDREAQKLERALGESGVLRVVCIPGMTNRAFMEGDTLVTPPRGVLKAINRQAIDMFDRDADAVAAVDKLAAKSGMRRAKR